MPSFIIHVGPHKTGTTYLQLSLKASRAALLEHGTLYPDFWDHAPGNPSQLPLVQHLRDNRMDLLQPRFDEIAASGAERVLISAEDLSNLDTAGLGRLRQLTGDNPVQIVFYLRRWSELMPSSWQEGIKQGQSYTLPEFVLLHLQRPEGSRLLNYDLKLTHMTDVFGPPALRLVGYSELRDREIDIFLHFAENFLDWTPPGPIPELQRANASRDPREIELLRILNGMMARRGEAPGDAMRKLFDRERAGPEVAALMEGMSPYAAKLRFTDNWPVLRGLREHLVEKYHDAILRPKRGQELFRLRNTELKYISADWLLRPGAAAALDELRGRLV